jgi:4-amino-4-deoxy-L-arabinose transferase-like glycosyltransferase
MILGWGLGELRLGEGDLVAREGVDAQDEAVYSFAAREMVRTGDWLTPRFLGRYFLYKPPAVYWLSGASVLLLGDRAASYRLPSLLASAATCALVFAAASSTFGWSAGLAAWLVLLSCPLWIELSRRNITDAVFCFAVTLAVLGTRRAGWAFSIGAALAILTKGAAGCIPLAVAVVLWSLPVWPDRPSWRQGLVACLRVALLALPWFALQLWLHPRWFYEEFLRVELFAWGLQAPPQTSAEPFWVFYGKHLLEQHGIPVLLAGTGCLAALWRRQRWVLVPLVWTLAMGLGIAAYSFRHATYLMPLVPALALLASAAPKPGLWLWIAAAPLLVWSAAVPHPPGHRVQPAIAALEERLAAREPAPLLVVGTGDHFYAAMLPFPAVRYALPDASMAPEGFALDFRSMGIAVTVDEFLHLDRHRPRFERVQQEWGLDRHDATATVILYRDRADLDRLQRELSEYDVLETAPGVRMIPSPR